MKIYIVRHGLTALNVGRPHFRGQLDIPLSEEGLKQAEEVAMALKDVPLDIIYFSPLQRAKTTAMTIAKFQKNNTVKTIAEPLLITMNFGDWQGRAHDDVFKNYEEKTKWYTNPNDFIIPNGETFYEIMARIHRLMIRLRGEPYDNVVLVTHRVVIINLLLYLLKLDPSNFWKIHVDTASITTIEYNRKGIFKITKLNDTSHLKHYVRSKD